VAKADYFDTASGKTEDKFTATGLTPVKSNLVNVSSIAEVPLVLERRLLHTSEIGLHTQFIGEIMDAKVEEALLGTDGFPDIKKGKPTVYAPSSRVYFGVGKFLGNAYTIGRSLGSDGLRTFTKSTQLFP
jgi:flavin reductase (DIM6/NTAB) family NADH-FMN oxidoreductase RutF